MDSPTRAVSGRRSVKSSGAKLPRFRLYDLRHTYASRLLPQNAPITYVSAQPGYTQPCSIQHVSPHIRPTLSHTLIQGSPNSFSPNASTSPCTG